MDGSNSEGKTDAENPKTENEEDVLTFAEIVQEFERREETAEILLGGQDETVCTYPEGYKPRQALFSCLTCMKEAEPAGICYGCSVNCHSDHDIVELYTKRSFKCDCGNEKFEGKKCQLYEEKDAKNEFNIYNHNFLGKFCVCDDTYPSEKTSEDMIQCTFCEDWHHLSHLSLKEPEADIPGNDNVHSLVCLSCVKTHPFLQNFTSAEENATVCHSKLETAKEDAVQCSIFIKDLRKRICKCSDCLKIYDKYQCEYLLDEEDDLEKFENDNMKKVEEAKSRDGPNNDQTMMREMVSSVGMEGTIQVLGAMNDFKRKLATFLENFDGKDGVVTETDMKRFVSQLDEERAAKRAKLMGEDIGDDQKE